MASMASIGFWARNFRLWSSALTNAATQNAVHFQASLTELGISCHYGRGKESCDVIRDEGQSDGKVTKMSKWREWLVLIHDRKKSCDVTRVERQSDGRVTKMSKGREWLVLIHDRKEAYAYSTK